MEYKAEKKLRVYLKDIKYFENKRNGKNLGLEVRNNGKRNTYTNNTNTNTNSYISYINTNTNNISNPVTMYNPNSSNHSVGSFFKNNNSAINPSPCPSSSLPKILQEYNSQMSKMKISKTLAKVSQQSPNMNLNTNVNFIKYDNK
jgi:hypothetical protein